MFSALLLAGLMAVAPASADEDLTFWLVVGDAAMGSSTEAPIQTCGSVKQAKQSQTCRQLARRAASMLKSEHTVTFVRSNGLILRKDDLTLVAGATPGYDEILREGMSFSAEGPLFLLAGPPFGDILIGGEPTALP